jgi:hypothetical protein
MATDANKVHKGTNSQVSGRKLQLLGRLLEQEKEREIINCTGRVVTAMTNTLDHHMSGSTSSGPSYGYYPQYQCGGGRQPCGRGGRHQRRQRRSPQQ